MNTKDIEKKIEKCVKTVETVEFLHRVPVSLPSQYKADLRGAIRAAFTEVWNEAKKKGRNEAIKECEGCVPEEGIKWMQEGFNKERKGYTKGFNSCREQTLQAISKLRV